MRDLSTADFVTLLRERGVKVAAIGGNLEIRTLGGGLPDELRRELAARKPELLDLLGEPPRTAAIPAAPAGEPPRLSFAQRRLWFMDQLGGASAAYNVPMRLELRGPLDAGALARSLAAIVARHEVLRTTLHAAGDEPRLVIDPEGRPRALELDLRPLPPGARDAEVQRHAAIELDTPFDLARDAMLRYRLLRCADEHHVLLLTTHHIACDAWSMSLLLRELASHYRAFVAGAAPDLPPLPIQHRDFARWQRDQSVEAELDYWRGQLHEPLPRSLPWPDRPLGARAELRGALASRTLPRELTGVLRRVSATSAASLFMMLGAALGVVLSRLCDTGEVLFGMPVAGRARVELEPLIGCFLNQLPLRIDLGGDPDFTELVARVRRVTLDALAHQDVPFDRMVEAIRPERAGGRHPIFEVMLNMINAPALELSLAGVAVGLHDQELSCAKYPLTLHAHDDGRDLALSLGYQVALFDAPTIDVLLDQLVGVLSQAARDPRQPIAALSLVTEATAPLIVDLRVAQDEPRECPVTAQIQELARAAPDRPAICCAGRTWSYGELVGRAEALARALAARGLTAGDVVAIDGPRSFGGVVGALGVLLAGGVFLNLDPSYPPERLAVMRSVARARFAVQLGDRVARDVAVPVALDPTTGALVPPDPDPDPSPARALPVITADHDAYVFFTSGSTGVPKAVLGWHGALAHFCRWYRGVLGATARDRVSQLAGPSFDGFLKDVFPPLTAGATVCLPDEAQAHDGPELLRWLAAERISIASAVPSRVQAWLRDVPPDVSLPHLRWLNLAGEPLRGELIHRWRAAFPGPTRIMNFYGATELTVLNCFFEVSDPAQPGIQCVGRARPDTQAFVARQGRVAGVGELGEVVLRSNFCTRGYLHDPAQTAARFAQNPERDDPRDRLYRTGDRGRLRPDGTLEVLGRLDDQVKVRGVRVELGEVKACLLGHAAVLDCEVVPRRTELLDDLVAYVVPRSGHTASPDELRAHAAAHLLPAMVPGAFVQLAALPLTANGKVDRAALPLPGLSADGARRAPTTPTERAMHALWCKLLGHPALGVDDNFFDRGGHSLLATQLVSRVRASLGVELTVRAVFTEPTIARLAARIDLLHQVQASADAAPGDDHERGVL